MNIKRMDARIAKLQDKRDGQLAKKLVNAHFEKLSKRGLSPEEQLNRVNKLLAYKTDIENKRVLTQPVVEQLTKAQTKLERKVLPPTEAGKELKKHTLWSHICYNASAVSGTVFGAALGIGSMAGMIAGGIGMLVGTGFHIYNWEKQVQDAKKAGDEDTGKSFGARALVTIGTPLATGVLGYFITRPEAVRPGAENFVYGVVGTVTAVFTGLGNFAIWADGKILKKPKSKTPELANGEA